MSKWIVSLRKWHKHKNWIFFLIDDKNQYPGYISTYIAQSSVQFDNSNFRKSIGDQKWIALFGQGLEAFAEWRRLDYPQLQRQWQAY